jgi:cytochrome c-type biogenesis protein CcmE
VSSQNKFIIAIVGVAVVVAFWIFWVSANPSSEQAMVKFLSIHELLEDTDAGRIRMGGLVKEGSINISKTNMQEVTFQMQEGDTSLLVRYKGTRPDLFKDGAEVIVEGVFRDSVFEADILQTKCASRYEGDIRDETTYNLDELN